MISRWFLALVILLTLSACADKIFATPNTIQTVGWLEQIKLYPSSMVLHAKLDTGADNCSVHADNITEYKNKGDQWVSFTISNRYGKEKTLKRRIVRIARIKTKRGGIQKRPVVKLGLCLGKILDYVECNLVDRSHFEYPVLIGRNYLAGTAAVNSSETYTSTPNCDIDQ